MENSFLFIKTCLGFVDGWFGILEIVISIVLRTDKIFKKVTHLKVQQKYVSNNGLWGKYTIPLF